MQNTTPADTITVTVPNTDLTTYLASSGSIEYTFLNDYMFHVVFQNIHILTGFLCALLKMKPDDIQSIVVTNPIIPGESIDDKTIVLDIKIVLDDSSLIDLELQVLNKGNWPERSLTYLCRTFDNLHRNEDYKNVRSALHIGILDFTLFPEHPEFYAVNKMMNEKNHRIYSDKFQLNVLDLNHIELATEEDKAYGLHDWAALFKATTWEDIKMLATTTQNPYISDAAQKLYEACADFNVRDACLRRAEQERDVRELKAKCAALQDENASLQDENASLRAKLAQYETAK